MGATVLEKEAVALLFCKLANLLRLRMSAFGCDVKQAVKCLQVLVKAIDARSLAKTKARICQDFNVDLFLTIVRMI